LLKPIKDLSITEILLKVARNVTVKNLSGFEVSANRGKGQNNSVYRFSISPR